MRVRGIKNRVKVRKFQCDNQRSWTITIDGAFFVRGIAKGDIHRYRRLAIKRLLMGEGYES